MQEFILILVRHAEPSYPKDIPRILGTSPSFALTQAGRNRCAEIKEAFARKYSLSHVFASETVRAQETAHLCTHHNIVVDARLNERNWGRLDGVPQSEVDEDALRNWHNPEWDYVPPEGESYRQLQQRVLAFHNQVIDPMKETNNFVAVFSHFHVMMTYILGLFELPDHMKKQLYFDMGRWCVIKFYNGRWELRRINAVV